MNSRVTGCVVLTSLLVASPAVGQITGTWHGVLRVAGIELGVVIRFARTDSGLQGFLDVPAQGQSGLPLTSISFTSPEISFQRVTQVGVLAFRGHVAGDSVTGQITQAGMEGTFALARGAPPAASVPAPVAAIQRPDLERTFLAPCSVPGVGGQAYCGRYPVPEDRATGSGRTIALNVVVLPAPARDATTGPLVVLAGGPGGAATQMAPAMGVLFPDLVRRTDVLLVDQRGTGKSNPLQCAFDDIDALAGAMLLLRVPDERVAVCRDRLQARLQFYTTPIAMDDLDELRAALGYDRVNLFGMSYGTRAALVYARRHPRQVRTITLQGIAPPTRRLPRMLAHDAQAALDATLGACVAEPDCRDAYGMVPPTVDTVLARLRQAPASLQVDSGTSPWSGTLRITDGIFAGGLRLMLYGAQSAGRIPAVVSSAARGDYQPFVEAVRPLLDNLGATLFFGAFLSVTCAEDLPGLDLEAVHTASEGTVLGDRMARNHERLCAVWPRGALPSGYHDPVRSEAPTLMLSGSLDPVTPPQYAQEVGTYLPNSLAVTVPNAGHADVITACEGRIVAAFILAGTTEGLDIGCVVPRRRRFLPPVRTNGPAKP